MQNCHNHMEYALFSYRGSLRNHYVGGRVYIFRGVERPDLSKSERDGYEVTRFGL